MNAELQVKLISQAEKAEIRGQQLVALLDWVEDVILRHGLIESIEKGFSEIAGMKDGEPTFRITPAGKKYVQSMPTNP